MNQPFRLIFDDCLSKHAVAALQSLSRFTKGSVEFAHLVDFNLGGEIDDDWVPRIAAETWIAITTDRGKKRSRGGKLPILCQRYGLTYVMFSSAIHDRGMFDKIRALFCVWPQLRQIEPGNPCRGYLVHLTTKADSVALKCVWTPPGDEPPKTQLLAF